MRFTNIHLLGAGAALGTLVPVTELLDPPRLARMASTGQRAVSIAHHTSGPDLAVRAARAALATAALTGSGPLPVPDLHLHTAIWRGSKGIDFWSAVSYVRNRLGLPPAPALALEASAMSNSMTKGLEIAARVLAGSPDLHAALLTGADVFGPPAFPHLTADRGIAYGDGGSSLVLGRRPGLARLVSTATYDDSTLEGLHRGGTSFSPPGTVETGVVDVAGRKHAYLDTCDGADSVLRRNATGVTAATATALAEADLSIEDLAWVLTPNYGHAAQDAQCLQPLGITADHTLRGVGDQWGHLGPHDQIAGLVHLLARGAVAPGDHVLLLGIGVGMSWTAAVLQIEQVPTELAGLAPPLRWPWRTPAAVATAAS